jgi:GDP-L-fucose synthase
MEINSKIYVAGHRGMVGSAILRKLHSKGYNNIITKDSSQLDLTDINQVKKFFSENKPEYVFLAAAKVGGIVANSSYPADFIYNNLSIQTNIIHQSYLHNVKKLLFLGSSCIYPRDCPQPIKEEYFMSGRLESTNDAYAIAKIAGIKMCQSYNKQYGTNFISVMPTNLYGQNDNYHIENSHVFPAMIKKFHDAKTNNKSNVVLWGTGEPYREFLNVDDCADACLFLIDNYNSSDIINIGTGKDISIKDLAYLIKNIIGFKGEIIFDKNKPNGTPRKLLDVSKINSLGWKYSIELKDGIKDTYDKFIIESV